MSRSAPSGAALHSSSANTLDSLVSEKGKLAQMGRSVKLGDPYFFGLSATARAGRSPFPPIMRSACPRLSVVLLAETARFELTAPFNWATFLRVAKS